MIHHLVSPLHFKLSLESSTVIRIFNFCYGFKDFYKLVITRVTFNMRHNNANKI